MITEKEIRVFEILQESPKTKTELAVALYGKIKDRADKQKKIGNMNRDYLLLLYHKKLIHNRQEGLNVFVELTKRVYDYVGKEIVRLVKLQNNLPV